MRNPKWHRDEIILALDLYFRDDRGTLDKSNPKVIELSKLLNSLPLFSDRPDAVRFRNPNGVALKLTNFLAIDPQYPGKGMESFSKLDEATFLEFTKDRERLHAVAAEIKAVLRDEGLKAKVYQVEEDEQTIKDSVQEGQVLYKLHKVRERDAGIIQLKKSKALKQYGTLSCEVCVFDFRKFYGSLGEGYIECHHKTPLHKFKVNTRTTLDDLALVCANCHRMLHRDLSGMDIERLRQLVG